MGTQVGLAVSISGDHQHIPMRTCIATRRKLPQSELLRIVVLQGSAELMADPDRKQPGRGCWITPSLDAFELAKKRKAFSRALRVSAPVDTNPVRKYLTALTLDLDNGKKTEH